MKKQFSQFRNLLIASLPIIVLIAASRAESFQGSLGFQLHQGTTDLTTLSTDAVTSYSGPGYVGEITFHLYDSDLAKKTGSILGIQPGINIFFFGGSTKEASTSNAVGNIKANQIAGAGVDLRLRRFFIGSFAQTNNSVITTSTASTAFNYTTLGIRSGFEFSISGSDDTTMLQLGALYEMGRSPITAIGSWHITSTSVFVGIKFRFWKGSDEAGY